ncbi:MAG TPA: OsmC family protein [Allosphingosinicella sp.]|nr:OsmC family protein [Allosphingosinicella sp.]
MAEHLATVEWRSGGGFREGRYSRAHSWSFDGGAVVPASASPHVVGPPLSDPAGVDPEEALVASVSSCHMLWFLHLARDSGLDVAAYRDEARGTMGKDERGRMAMTRIVLRPEIEFAGEAPDPGLLQRLHHEAHIRCFIANSLRTEIVVE